MILLIPAGWSLWLAPSGPPNLNLFALIMIGGLLVSGAGCIANDLWDKEIDAKVKRTQGRPLANKKINLSTAVILFLFLLLISLQIIFLLPLSSRNICLTLSAISLIPIVIYPSSKRWFKYPQLLLSICWGFAVLIPWAASESALDLDLSLLTCWLSAMVWTFGFDTVYAMADKEDDEKLGLNSSAISLGKQVIPAIGLSYGTTCFLLAIAACSAGVNWKFWPIWILVSIGMQRELFALKQSQTQYINHFKNQVLLGALMLTGLLIGRTG